MAKKPDLVFLSLFFFLIFWGALTLASVSFPFSLEKYNNSWYFFLHQLLLGLLPGLLLGYLAFRVDLKTLKNYSHYLFAFNLLLLIFVFLPKIGFETKGARRWLVLGPILFQPSELLKITFLLYLSAWLSNRANLRQKGKKTSKQALFVFLVVSLVLGLILIAQPDFSTLFIILSAAFIIYFISVPAWWHSVLIVVGSIVLGGILIKLAPYRFARVLPVLRPQIDPLGIGYQLKQALIAIGSGKIFGIGEGFSLGLSRQKFGFLPHPMTDSIFAVIGEELGFLGASFLVLLFLYFAFRGFKIANGSKTLFGKLLAYGLTSFIVLQAFLNMGGIIGILPLAGIPLPFFSYGASHLITELIGVGILLNISKS
jgi:cell division protein FtsW